MAFCAMASICAAVPLLKRGKAQPFPIGRGRGEETNPHLCLRLLRLGDKRRGEKGKGAEEGATVHEGESMPCLRGLGKTPAHALGLG